MLGRISLVLWLGVAGVTCSTGAAESGTIRIVCIGDSITQGGTAAVGTNGQTQPTQSYRYPLWKMLLDASVPVQFVGTQTTGFNGSPNYDPYKGQTFPNISEGYWGQTTWAVEANIATTSASWTADIATILLGTNDQATDSDQSATMQAMTGIVSILRADNPHMVILIGKPLEEWSPFPAMGASYAALAASLTTAASPVIAVDRPADFVSDPNQAGTDTVDWVHPNSQGDAKVAQTFFNAMQPYLAVASAATQVSVETKADGSGALLAAQNVAAGSALTVFAVSRDAAGNFMGNVAADSWSLSTKTGGVADSDLVPSGDTKSAIFTGHLIGTAVIGAASGTLTLINSGTLTVIAGAAAHLRIETLATGAGTLIPDQALPTGNALTVFAVACDNLGNFVNNVAASWSLSGSSGGVATADLSANTGGKSATFAAHFTGTTVIQASVTGLAVADSGTITVTAPPTLVRVETAADGSGSVVPLQNLQAGNALTVYAISRNGLGAFVANVAAAWSLVNPTDGVVDGDLQAGSDGKSATFTGHLVGTAALQADFTGLTPVPSGVLSVRPGPVAGVQVETAADGSGTVVPAQTLYLGQTLTVYANTRGGFGNLVANVAAVWSLVNTTGHVTASTDLAPSLDQKSAVFTAHLTGSAQIHAVLLPYTSTDSGVISVPVVYGTGPDADGDSFADSFETGAGLSSAADANATPFDNNAMATAQPHPLPVGAALSIKANFKAGASDNLTLSGTLPLPRSSPALPATLKVVVAVNNYVKGFTLTKGKAPKDATDPKVSFSVGLKPSSKNTVKFSFKESKPGLYQFLGLSAASTPKNHPTTVQMTVTVLFNNAGYQSVLALLYTSNGKTASTKPKK